MPSADASLFGDHHMIALLGRADEGIEGAARVNLCSGFRREGFALPRLPINLDFAPAVLAAPSQR